MSLLEQLASRCSLPPRLAHAVKSHDLAEQLMLQHCTEIALGSFPDGFDKAAARHGVIGSSTVYASCLSGASLLRLPGETLEGSLMRREAAQVRRGTSTAKTQKEAYSCARLASEAGERARAEARRIRDRAVDVVTAVRSPAASAEDCYGWRSLLAGAREPSFDACLSDEGFMDVLSSSDSHRRCRVGAIEAHLMLVFDLSLGAGDSQSTRRAQWWLHSVLKTFGVAFHTLHDLSAPLSVSRAFAAASVPCTRKGGRGGGSARGGVTTPKKGGKRSSIGRFRSKLSGKGKGRSSKSNRKGWKGSALSEKNVRALRALLESESSESDAHRLSFAQSSGSRSSSREYTPHNFRRNKKRGTQGSLVLSHDRNRRNDLLTHSKLIVYIHIIIT